MVQPLSRMGLRIAVVTAMTAACVCSSVGSAGAADADGVIAYTRTAASAQQLVVRAVDPATGVQSWLAAGSTSAWSPNGRRLAFVGTTGKVRIRNADGSVTATGVPAYGAGVYTGADMAWAPDGTRLAFGYQDQVWVMNVARPYNPHPVSPGTGYAPTWSPDSTRIAYSGYDDDIVGDLYVMKSDGTENVDVTRTPRIEESRPDWSPDGSTLAYLANPMDNPNAGLYVAGTDGAAPHRIAVTHVFGWQPDWSPTGTRIAYIGDNGLAVVDADGQHPGVVIAGRNVAQPDWRSRPAN
jgi:Tol biopolymer transport system component